MDVYFPFVEDVIPPDRIVVGEWTDVTLVVSCEAKPEALYGREANELRLEEHALSADDFIGTLWIPGPLSEVGPVRQEFQISVLYIAPGGKTLSLQTVAAREQGGSPGRALFSSGEYGTLLQHEVDLVIRQFHLTVLPAEEEQ